MPGRRFCKKCGQRLPDAGGFLSGFSKEKVYEFADGFYCEPCAEAKVKKVRK